MTNPPKLKVALIGYGLAGRVFHAPLIRATPDLELTTIVTGDPSRSRQATLHYPSAEILPDVDALFRRPNTVDLVVVATSNDSHVPLARRSIEAGTPVVVDKPLAASSQEARELLNLSEEMKVPLTVFQNRRWDGDFMTVASLVQSGRLGRVHRFESRFERWRTTLREECWREDPDPAKGGGLLLDLGSHLVDQVLNLFGDAVSVYAEVNAVRQDSKVDDDIFIAIAHSSGVRSHLWASALAAIPGPRFRVLGAAGAVTTWGLDPQEALLATSHGPATPVASLQPTQDEHELRIGDTVERLQLLPGTYERFYAEVASSLVKGTSLPVRPIDAVRALEVLEAARRSSAEGRVVMLSQSAPG